jgi:hypothetical protein
MHSIPARTKSCLFPIFLLALSLLIPDCKSKSTDKGKLGGIYRGFVVSKNGVSLLKSPGNFKEKLGVIPFPSQFGILEDKIPDPKLGEKKYWYKVRAEISGKITEGFISYDEAILAQSISVFHGFPTKMGGIITANDLNVRDFPGTNSKVIFQLKQFDLVEVQSQGSFQETIHGRTGNWMEIKTLEGKQGFAFGSHIKIYPYEEALAAQARKEIEISGLIRITKDKPFFSDRPGSKSKISKDDLYSILQCYEYKSEAEPQKGEFIRVDRKAEVDGKFFYFARYIEVDGMEGCEVGAGGWIEESYGQFFSFEEYTKYTRQNASHLKEDGIQALINFNEALIKKGIGGYGPLNLELSGFSIPVWDARSGSPNVYIGYLYYGNRHQRSEEEKPFLRFLKDGWVGSAQVAIFVNTEKGFTPVSDLIWGRPEFIDLDEDGKPEILLTQEERGGVSYTLLGWKGGSLVPVPLGVDGSDMNIEITPEKHLNVQYGDYDEATDQYQIKTRTLKYQNGSVITL